MHPVTGTGRLIAGRYRLQDPIGRGAMGIVWRGRDELLARDVAIKEVQITGHTPPADAEALYQRTLREARTAARLNHPSVITVFDVVEENGSPWIVMELVEARSLDRILAEDGPLPPLRAAELGVSLVSALATAHCAGVLHRDVKPSNVLVGPDGRVVLTDFGIAMFAEDPALTNAGMVFGTPGFTAPERIRGDVATPASDLWSLGATLYAAVEGRGPFERSGGSAVITAGVAAEEAPRATAAGPLGPVIDALLGRDPGTRPDSTTAARLLAEAAAAAGTCSQPLADGPLAAESDTADRAAHAPTDEVQHAAVAAHAELASDKRTASSDSVGTGSGGPVFWQPIGDRYGQPPGENRPSNQPSGPPSGAGGGQEGPGGPGSSGTPARHSRGRQVLLACIGIAAIVLAAVAGWNLFSHTGAGAALQNTVPSGSGVSAPDSGGNANAGGNSGPSGKAGTSGGPGSGTSPGGSNGGNPAANPSGHNPSSGPSATTSPSTGPSATTSPSPTPSGPVLPAGYEWHRFTSLALGSTAGFKIAMPDGWTQSIGVLLARLSQPAAGFHLNVGVGLWKYAKPLAQAQHLYSVDRLTFHDFKLQTLTSVQFSSIGGYRAASAAELKFSWTKLTGGTFTELILLVTLNTKSGAQPYAFTLWAPSATFSVAHGVFNVAIQTFRPLTS